MAPGHIFLLSPAKAGGRRYSILTRAGADFDLALKLRAGNATIGEVYSFISGLYFRGKMVYTEAFRASLPNVPCSLVIVPGAGLVPPETIISIEQLEAIAAIPVSENNPAFRDALLASARPRLNPACRSRELGGILKSTIPPPRGDGTA